MLPGMTQAANEQTVDVREMPPRDRHPTIMNSWRQLPPGGAIVLVNDHDPLPLYYQFSCEHGGTFRWDYLESGPATWRVRLSKGDFPNPGFTPPKKTDAPKTTSKSAKSVVLDVRPIFAAGQTPCTAIDDAVASLKPDQTFVLLVPFEPAPLYAKLKAQGFAHQTKVLDDGTCQIEFKKSV
jgi:uncharacterized protein (DUF2249 family)